MSFFLDSVSKIISKVTIFLIAIIHRLNQLVYASSPNYFGMRAGPRLQNILASPLPPPPQKNKIEQNNLLLKNASKIKHLKISLVITLKNFL